MWTSNGNSIQMTEGDFGIALPITISGVTFASNDSIRIEIKKDAETVLTKDFTNIVGNEISLELTAEESELLTVGVYLYSLDWYRDGAFMCNIVPFGLFVVGDKA